MTPTDRARLEDLYPPFRLLVEQVVAKAHAKLDEIEPRRWRICIRETSRTRAAQLADKQSGASNAQPDKAPHCVQRKDGSPAAMAADLWIVDAVSAKLAPDGELVWSVIPFAAYEVGASSLKSGAFFRTIPGGDWCHIELRRWETLVDFGVLKAG